MKKIPAKQSAPPVVAPRAAAPSNGSRARSNEAEVLELARYAIGTRLRHARLMRGSRLKDVADAAGCSESLVSKIENNKVEPSLQVLHKLCSVLKIGLGDLFNRRKRRRRS